MSSDYISFEDRLYEEVKIYIGLKRQHELLVATLRACGGQRVLNDLVYQLMFLGADGLIVRIVNFSVRFYDFLDDVKGKYLDSLKYGNWKKLKQDTPQGVFVGDDWTDTHKWAVESDRVQMLRGYFKQAYERLFPEVIKRENCRLNHSDIDALKSRIEIGMKPVRDHRNTVSAHWDEEDSRCPATFKQLETAFLVFEEVLGDLMLISSLKGQTFELGGAAAPVDKTAIDLATLIIRRS